MNAAFRRGEAITRLEHYANVIMLHLCLTTCFPESSDVNHWNVELEAFAGVLRRYNKSKSKSGNNYTHEDICRSLLEVIESNDGKDYIANDIMGSKKGMEIDSHAIDWTRVEQAVDDFATKVLSKAS